MKKYNIKFFYPNYFNNKGITYVCLSIAENMVLSGFNISVMGIASSKDVKSTIYRDAIPSFVRKIAYRLFSNKAL